MKKAFIQPETIKKLQTVSAALYEKYGVDVVNFSNFTSLIKKENDKLQVPMSYLTYTERVAYIAKIIKNLDELKTEEKKQETKPEVKEVDYLIVVYKDGSIERKEPKIKQQSTDDTIYLGLFDYHDNLIIIRRGDYSGCNIKSKSSIKAYFKDFNWFETWCKGRLDDVTEGKITPNRDTPRDIETLNMILKQLEERKSDVMI